MVWGVIEEGPLEIWPVCNKYKLSKRSLNADDNPSNGYSVVSGKYTCLYNAITGNLLIFNDFLKLLCLLAPTIPNMYSAVISRGGLGWGS